MSAKQPPAADAQEAELRVLRDQIDSVDRQIHQLLNDRARLAQQVASVKEHYRQGDETPVFYRPEREAQVLRAVMARNEGPLADVTVARLFREVMSVCLALEESMQVVFLGPEGTFTQQAAQKHFGQSACCHALDSLEQVFTAVERGEAHYAVVPIESENAGLIRHTLDLFRRFNLFICGEVELSPEVSSKAVNRSPRYLVVGREAIGPSGDDKTSLLLVCEDEPGALHDLLAPFHRRQISLTRLETRSSGEHDWNMLFYIDFEGHNTDAQVSELLAELDALKVEVKHLGSYPKAVL
ncbi:MAG: chorismate mutase [Oceanospirillales bacterium]|uniref:Bifunctional chorismate mutase/prephenate dehydratase n=1 Tax=Marinobacterium halophilum TaxID=267374 RepID=A0A2P8F139_9GAMM|nr:chorismate mutase [Marinobacterium halophilum]MBR9827595.1 chorismate mutase [Oceanospirillales bacterium]PSL15429.1 chorismate mutase [Marinobacterium halophilum]